MPQNYTKIITAGIAGTIAMTIVGLFGAPMMGLAPMNPASMLAGAMGGMVAMGSLIGHVVYGLVVGAILGDSPSLRPAQ